MRFDDRMISYLQTIFSSLQFYPFTVSNIKLLQIIKIGINHQIDPLNNTCICYYFSQTALMILYFLYLPMNGSTIAKLISQSHELHITAHSKQQEVQAWLKNNIPVTTKTFKDSVHFRSIQFGFEIEFEKQAFNTFFAYFRTQKIHCCEYPLRFGINKGWTIKGAVMYLGEPPTKSKRAIEIIYPHLGLGLVFGGTWSNQNSLISQAYFYPPQKIRVCANCSKQFQTSTHQNSHLFNQKLKVLICKCQFVSYCSDPCLQKHHGQHLIFCDIAQEQ